MLVILEIKLDLVSVDTAVSVDLINSGLGAVLNCETIYSSRACDRPIPPILNTLSEDASLEAPAAAVVASAAAAAVVSVVEDELPQAVKEVAIASARLKLKTLFFIIDSSSGTCYHDNRSMLCRVAVKRLKIILNYREFVSKCQANLFFNEKIVAVWLCSARTATTRAGVPLRNGGSD